MTRKKVINVVNLTLLVFGLVFMNLKISHELNFIGIGFFVSSVLTLLFNNIDNE